MIKQIRYWNIILLAFLSLTITVVHADDATLENGVKAVENQDYMTAYQIFKNLAEQGNPEAQYNLAILYKQGKGVMQDVAAAVNWFQKAADQGLPSAQYYMGHLYDEGEGVGKNFTKAVEWYQKAAEQGDPLAQTNLGVAYANGEGIKQDVVLAYVWFSLAASQGLTSALENRNLLKKDMSEKLVQNAQRLTREYFNQYVAPYQPQTDKLGEGHHPRADDAHRGLNIPNPVAPPSAGNPPPGHGKP